MGEEWKRIKGYRYEVSNLGRIRRLPKHGEPKILKTGIHRTGYVRVNLADSGVQTHFLVHRLVAIHFIRKRKNKPYVNHKNGVKHDNRVENLEWCTSSENNLHAYRVLGRVGKNGYPGISVRCIETGVEYESVADASEDTGVFRTSIFNMLSGRYKTAGGFTWEKLSQ